MTHYPGIQKADIIAVILTNLKWERFLSDLMSGSEKQFDFENLQ